MEKLLSSLKLKLPAVVFEAGESFYWSPKYSKITYKTDEAENEYDLWSLLHEAAHALLKHDSYALDFDLLLLEVTAWQKAKELGLELGIKIDEDHIQNCLDTYRDWLHQRATCPRCSTVSLQVSSKEYKCHNCLATWQVSPSKFCRPYRLSSYQTKKSPKALPQATFQ